MNRSINFTQLGGLYVYQDTLDFLQLAYGQSLDAIAKIIGDKVILTGVVDAGATASEGWIVFNGEILPFTGGLKAQYVIVEEIVTNEQFDDTQQRPVYKVRRLKFGNVIPALGGFAYADLTRLAYNSADIKTSLSAVQTVLKSVINFENEVILSGCTVSNVVGSNMQVSIGSVLFAGNLVTSAAYTGPFPAYLKDTGTWVTVQPVSGLYIKFDPHTSQRYKDVLRRFNHDSGAILMNKVLSDRFDITTGLGKWEWLGFKLSEDFRGRSPIGLWFGDNGGPDVYDPAYRTIGNVVGEINHTIARAELPNESLSVPIIGANTSQDDVGSGRIAMGDTGNDGGPYPTLQSEAMGDGESFDLRQPSKVLAIIERI